MIALKDTKSGTDVNGNGLDEAKILEVLPTPDNVNNAISSKCLRNLIVNGSLSRNFVSYATFLINYHKLKIPFRVAFFKINLCI